MRFLLRSAFWLGLTFHAMPWGDAKLSDALPDVTPAVVSLAVASANGDGAVAALARGALRGALDLDAPAAAKPQRASLDTLSPADRPPPWRGRSSAARQGAVGAAPRRAWPSGSPAAIIGAQTAPKPSDPLTSIDAIRADFAFLDEWEDRYRYVIELGRTLEPLDGAAHNDANRVRGCVSQVWLEHEVRRDAAGRTILHYRGDSDSHLVRGLVAIAVALYSDRTPEAIARHGRRCRVP